MLNLTKDSITNQRAQWEQAGFALPQFDLDAVYAKTQANPTWIHFGAGNIFRAFPATNLQQLLDQGKADTGIIVCETFDEAIIEKSFKPHDNLTTVVTLLADGGKELSVSATIAESLTLTADRQRLHTIFENPSLQMASMTITEKGYQTHDANGAVLPWIEKDLQGGLDTAASVPALLASLLHSRYQANKTPLALVSMDNCAYNGDLLKKAVLFIAQAWLAAGHVDQAFIDWASNDITYPISMIDKITPGPSDTVAAQLQALGYTATDITKTDKNTQIASFVNAEETGYLVIEDIFPNGRPALEQCGIIFTDRDTVNSIEKMKVGACLNPLHTIIAIFGSLLRYTTVSQSMTDTGLVKLIKTAGYTEALPHVPNPGVISPQEFIDTVINVRFPNPFIPDQPQRIATDTSLKIPVRFGEVLKTMQDKGLDMLELVAIPFFVAGWFRYLMEIGDDGQPLTLSPDPMLATLTPIFADYKLGQVNNFNQATTELLQNKAIFGIDLAACGLATKIQAYFDVLTQGPGAVRTALDGYANQ